MRAVAGFAFGPCLLDTRAKHLTRVGEHAQLSRYQYDIVHLLVNHAGEVLPKGVLTQAGWPHRGWRTTA
jgi:DNA-binding winged helix-turn-helix (wHTH) protein